MSIGSVLTTAQTGLQKSARSVHLAANRIARAPLHKVAQRGVEQSAATLLNVRSNAKPQSVSEESLIEPIMEMKKALASYKTSASLIRTADEMSDTLDRTFSSKH